MDRRKASCCTLIEFKFWLIFLVLIELDITNPASPWLWSVGVKNCKLGQLNREVRPVIIGSKGLTLNLAHSEKNCTRTRSKVGFFSYLIFTTDSHLNMSRGGRGGGAKTKCRSFFALQICKSSFYTSLNYRASARKAYV